MPKSNSATDDVTAPRLQAVLGPISAAAIVVGAVIGSGVFLKPASIAQATQGYVGVIVSLWMICGLVNLCGALALAELAAMMPQAGGLYVFLREAYGRPWAFLWAWAEFWVVRSGSIAALAAAMALNLEHALHMSMPFSPLWRAGLAIGTIAALAVINILGTHWGGWLSNVTTTIKIAAVAFLAVLPFLALQSPTTFDQPLWPATWQLSLLGGLGTALSGIMWAYDGWAHLPMVSEEIRAPERNLPRALIGGTLLLIVLYTSANVAYHLILPSDVIAVAKVPAAAAAETLLPHWGERFVLSMIGVSVFGALNANVLVGPRVLFAVARDYEFLKPWRRIDPRFGTPAMAIAGLAVWSTVLILAGGLYPDPNKRLYDVLTDYCIFGASVFNLAAVVAVIALRRQQASRPRPYRCWGYPLVPAVFIVGYLIFLGTMLWAAPVECLVGLSLLLLGAVFYRGVARSS